LREVSPRAARDVSGLDNRTSEGPPLAVAGTRRGGCRPQIAAVHRDGVLLARRAFTESLGGALLVVIGKHPDPVPLTPDASARVCLVEQAAHARTDSPSPPFGVAPRTCASSPAAGAQASRKAGGGLPPAHCPGAGVRTRAGTPAIILYRKPAPERLRLDFDLATSRYGTVGHDRRTKHSRPSPSSRRIRRLRRQDGGTC
jgi:hypothetical protein